MTLPVEAWAPLASVPVAAIVALGAVYGVRRRDGNSNQRTPLNCPFGNGQKVALSDDSLNVLTGALGSIKDEVQGLRSLQGKALDTIGGQAATLAVIKDRLGRQGGDDE